MSDKHPLESEHNPSSSLDTYINRDPEKSFIELDLDQSVASAVEELGVVESTCRRIHAASNIYNALAISMMEDARELKRKYLQVVDLLNPESINPYLREQARNAQTRLKRMYVAYVARECQRIQRSTLPSGVLGIHSSASFDEIRATYTTLAAIIHPDTAPPQLQRESTLAMSRLNNAYDFYRRKIN